MLLVVLLAGAGFAPPSDAAAPAAYEGLVPVPSRNFDELFLRPGADLAAYRKVLIDPVPVEMHPYWLKNMNYTRNASRWVGADDARRIAEEASASLQRSVAEAFMARGYEIAAAPEPGVLRVSPSITGLYVNAPDRHSAWRAKTFTREAGDAVLVLEARDAVTAALLGRVVHHAKAQEMGRLARANDVSNRFWFEAMFNRWAANCVAVFEAGPNRP